MSGMRQMFSATLPRLVSTLLQPGINCRPAHRVPLIYKKHIEVRVRPYTKSTPLLQKDTVKVVFQFRNGEKQEVSAKVGDNLLDVIIEHDVDIDGYGACEGTLACSTCHLIFKPADFEKIPDKATDEELDMLDLAYGLTDTSRLGCQVIVTKEMEGMVVQVPEGVADARGGSL